MACKEGDHNCVYSQSEKRVTVSENYLFDLQARAQRGVTDKGSQDGFANGLEKSSQGIELGFKGADNWVLGSSGEYRKLTSIMHLR